MHKGIMGFVCAAALAATAVSASAAGLASFVGAWANTNPATRGIVKIVILPANAAGQLGVNPFGACVPKACDWGIQPGTAYAPSVQSNLQTQANALTVVFNQGFATTTMTLMEEGSLLKVTSFTHFTDGSHRTDYDATEMFKK